MQDEEDSHCPPSTKSPRGSSCHSGILGGREVAVVCDMGGGEVHERGSDDASRSWWMNGQGWWWKNIMASRYDQRPIMLTVWPVILWRTCIQWHGLSDTLAHLVCSIETRSTVRSSSRCWIEWALVSSSGWWQFVMLLVLAWMAVLRLQASCGFKLNLATKPSQPLINSRC